MSKTAADRAKWVTVLFLLSVLCSGEAKASIIAQHACEPSDALYAGDVALMQHRAPTYFRLMPSRWLQIVEAARGMECTGTVTVAFNGRQFIQAGRSDDAGIAELIPVIASWTGLDLARSFDLTAAAVVLFGVVLGYAGFWRAYPAPSLRRLGAIIFAGLGMVEAVIANVHLFQSSPMIAGVPWVLFFARKDEQLRLNATAALLAFCCAWSSLIRIGSCLFCMVFLVTFFVCRGPARRALLSLALISAACLPAFLVQHALNTRRDALLASLGNPVTVENNHTIWHSIYIGLAFIPNAEIPRYDDQVGIDRVRSIDPAVAHTSVAYEAILRREVFALAKRNPLLLVENLVAKAAIMFALAVVLLFPARRSLMASVRERWVDAAFIAVILATSMNAILVIPRPPYLLSFICFASLYSLVRFCDGRSSRNSQPEANVSGRRSAMAAFSLMNVPNRENK